MEEASVHEKELTAVIHSEQSEPFQHLKLVNETDSHERLHDETISDVEVLRPGLSREASYTGSLVTMSTSRFHRIETRKLLFIMAYFLKVGCFST